MTAKDQLSQTQEKLQTNGDTNSPPEDSNFHLLSLDQKVKRHSQAGKGSVQLHRLSSLGLLSLTGATVHPFCIAHPLREDGGLEGKEFI